MFRKLTLAAIALGILCGQAQASGWYVIVPPSTNRGVYPYAVLSLWYQVDQYDTARECGVALNSVQESVRAKPHDWIQESFLYGLCVSSDDPRLLGRRWY